MTGKAVFCSLNIMIFISDLYEDRRIVFGMALKNRRKNGTEVIRMKDTNELDLDELAFVSGVREMNEEEKSIFESHRTEI